MRRGIRSIAAGWLVLNVPGARWALREGFRRSADPSRKDGCRSHQSSRVTEWLVRMRREIPSSLAIAIPAGVFLTAQIFPTSVSVRPRQELRPRRKTVRQMSFVFWRSCGLARRAQMTKRGATIAVTHISARQFATVKAMAVATAIRAPPR